MSFIIVDRRKNDKGKSTPNRQRYVRRVKDQVREAVKKTITNGNIKDITDTKGKRIKISGKGLSQPTFNHDSKSGQQHGVHPGNKEFTQGDRFNRQKGGEGGGGQGGSPDGDGEDDFSFSLSKDEFVDIFFEDMALPDMVKKTITKIDEYVNKRAGFSTDGNPSRLNVFQSMKQSKGRMSALRTPKRKKLKRLEAELAELEDSIIVYANKGDGWETMDKETIDTRIAELKKEIEVLKRRIKAVPFMDDNDLRYNRWEKQPMPSTQAVMFAVMDVSASMGEWEKEMAKRFFMLLYLFLTKNYKRVEIVFIRHTHTAAEVTEEEFFYSKETGGTLVSTSIELIQNIIKERYNPELWNIFVSQASDGDNWPDDSLIVQDMLRKNILPIAQYMAYVELNRYPRDSDLWPYYQELDTAHSNFAMTKIQDAKDIFPVFLKLFKKRTHNE